MDEHTQEDRCELVQRTRKAIIDKLSRLSAEARRRVNVDVRKLISSESVLKK